MVYIDRDEILKHKRKMKGFGISQEDDFWDYAVLEEDITNAPTADVVGVDTVSEKIIRKQVEVSDYFQNDVKQYRAMKGYSNIEHDVDNFLRGYNEAVEDILAILDGTPKERGVDNGN